MRKDDIDVSQSESLGSGAAPFAISPCMIPGFAASCPCMLGKIKTCPRPANPAAD